jgi:hypothetical protein
VNASHWLKKRPVWAAILVAFAIGCWLQLGYRRSVASWFELYCRADRGRLHEEAGRELKAMGSKSVPFLVNEALSTKEDTQTRKDFYELLSSMPRALRLRKYVSYDQMRANARELLRELNPPAPDLIAAMRNSLSMVGTTNRYRALSLLSYTTNRDEVAAPYFIAALHDPLEATRKEGLHWMFMEHNNREAGIPDLIAILLDRNLPFADQGTLSPRVEAAFSIGSMHSNSVAAIPILKDYLQTDTNVYNKSSYALALCEIKPRQKEGFEFLLSCLTNKNRGYIVLGAWRLGLLGHDASEAIPSLIADLENADFQAWKTIIRALRKVGATPEQLMAAYFSKLQSTNGDFRVDAAQRIIGVNPSNEEAQNVLMNEIKSHSAQEYEAVLSLQFAGTNALRAVPVIETALDGTNAEVFNAATSALMALGAPSNTLLPKLRAKLKVPAEGDLDAIELARNILKIDPTDLDAQHTLQALIRKDGISSAGAIRVLMRAKPISQKTTEVLQMATKSEHEVTRDIAEEILNRLAKNLEPIDPGQEKQVREAIGRFVRSMVDE